MAKFKAVNPQVSFVELEKELLRKWYDEGIVEKYLHKNDNSPKKFSFLDGPITANNPMGVHHAWGRTYKDLWQRFYNMRGYKQRFQNGFDAQGLWVEVQVEKDLGLKSKKDIENLVPQDTKASIAKFVELCKERVYKYSAIQTEQSKRLGYFMDWENSYYTLSDENNYVIWKFLKKCHEKSLIYKGHDSVPWCPRCGTAISQHEMLTEDYKEVTHESIFVEYPVLGKEDTYLLIWTTTPWTLPANVAVAIDPKSEYAITTGEVKGNKYYILKSAADRLKLKILETLKGEELVGMEYTSPFDHLPRVKESMGGQPHKVVAADPLILIISEVEGTGLVHIAPGAGTEDFQLSKKYAIPVIDVIDEEAKYLDGMEEFSGKNAKDHPELILDYVKEKDGGKYFFNLMKYTHRYPACWRCHEELVWRVVDEWYIAMDPLRSELKEVAGKINWIPEFGLKRELDWLDNMHDWLISKKRYWGLALPIWECQSCGSFEVVGGKEELKEKASSGWEQFEGNSPHRPFVDEVKIKCANCGELATRVPDVGNPWLDAGIVPFSTMPKEWFPADFITESFPGQFKNWFYSLIAMSTVLENKEPFKTVLGFATLFAEDAKPMHKSSGNMIEFNEGADKIGVDVMRWIYAKQDPSENLLFGYHIADQTRRGFHLMLWNIYNFFVTNANADEWHYTTYGLHIDITDSPLDLWIWCRMYDMITTVTTSLEEYDARTAAFAIEEFVQDLSLWYIRRSRNRVGPNAPDGQDKYNCYVTLRIVLTHLCKVLAPFTPFIADEIFTNLTPATSVHLEDWWNQDEFEETLGGVKKDFGYLIDQMSVARKVVERGHAERKLANIPVRQPLARISVVHSIEEPNSSVVELVKDELNVKFVEWKVNKDLKDPEVTLDTTLTPELEEEGKTRELARSIQEERKKLGVLLTEKVDVTSAWLPQNPELLDWLKNRTLVKYLKLGDEFSVKKVQ